MSEFMPEVAVEMWAEAIKECKTRREIMAWVVDKLQRWEQRLPEIDRATCRELREALSDSNPKLRGGVK